MELDMRVLRILSAKGFYVHVFGSVCHVYKDDKPVFVGTKTELYQFALEEEDK